MANQFKPPLKVVVSGSNFHRKLSLYQRIKLHWSEPLKSHIRNFSSGVWGWSPHQPMEVVSSLSKYIKSEAKN